MSCCKPYIGLVCVTSSALVFGIVAAMVKLVQLPPVLEMQIRSLVQWAISLVVALVLGYRSNSQISLFGGSLKFEAPTRCGSFWLPAWAWLVLRSVLYWIFMFCWWSALDFAPVGDATALVYVGPVFTSIFAFLLLGEKLKLNFFVCTPLCILGVVFITQPVFLFKENKKPKDYDKGAIYALVGAVVCGLLPVCVRASRQCHWVTVEHITAFVSSFFLCPIGLLGFYTTDKEYFVSRLQGPKTQNQVLMLIGAAFVAFLALGLQTYGYQKEEASRASLMTFLEIPFAYLLQHFLFHQTITRWGFVGMCLILFSGCLNVYLKSRQQIDKKDENLKEDDDDDDDDDFI